MKLVVVPHAGLCNRLNAILSAIALKNSKQIEIELFWEESKECFAWFDNLFEPIKDCQVKRLTNFYLKPSSKSNLFLPSLLRKFKFDASFQGQKISNSKFLLQNEDLGVVYISSTNRFCPLTITSNLSRYFVPLPHIQKKIESVTSQYSRNTIGVHIRRTDNIAAIKNSPLEKYIEAMNQALSKESETCFYIATDDPNIKNELNEIYTGKIITYDATLNRNTLVGIEDAIVELWCLASCKRIIGSTHSTYSEFASLLYNIPITYITKN